MKSKYLKNILLGSFLGIILFTGTNYVKAADTQNNCGTTTMYSTQTIINIPNVHDQARFYLFAINGTKALCLNPGKSMSNGLTYVRDASPYSGNSLVIKAYNYATRSGASDMDQIAAQTVVWAVYSAGITQQSSLEVAIQQAFFQLNVGLGEVVSRAHSIMNGILSSSTSGTLYIWRKRGNNGNYQTFVSKATTTVCPPTDTPENPDCDPTVEDCDGEEELTCDIVTDKNLASCSSTYSSNYGYIVQAVSGNCKDEYVGWKNNVYGAPTSANVGSYCQMYCLDTFEENYPGNISTAVNVGSYIVWPNNNINSNQSKINANLAKYPMSATLTRNCRIMVNISGLNTAYSGYRSTMDSLSPYKTEYLEHDCQNLQNDVTEKQNDLTNKQTALNQCVASNGNTYTYWSNWESRYITAETCQSERSAVSSASAALDNAARELQNCNDYGAALTGAISVVREYNNCISASIENNLSFSADYSVSYNDSTYGETNFELQESGSSMECTGCTSTIGNISADESDNENHNWANEGIFSSKKSQVEARTIKFSISKTFDLKDGYYYYVDKLTNKSLSNLTSTTANYSTIGFSNLPISFDSDTTALYNLKLNVSVSGTNFDDEINRDDYVCHYTVKNGNDSCICPENTENKGKDLSCYVSTKNQSTSGYTCATAIEEVCNSNSAAIIESSDPDICPEKYVCPEGTMNAGYDLTACITSGKSYQWCENYWCDFDITNPPVCPRGTTNEGMDLTSCVYPMVNKGMSYADALVYCQDVSCPTSGVKIIYRTISLINPFPGFNANSTVSSSSPTRGMFNMTVSGRYPGSNWNSSSVVYSRILQNRGTAAGSGYDVYDKEPLYTFVLTPDLIKEIRKYNARQSNGYADFNLSCKLNNSKACISEFVHSSLSGLVSGSCKSLSSNGANFYTCDD
jgi:hypothetical protein